MRKHCVHENWVSRYLDFSVNSSPIWTFCN